ncbi:hypothetical protein EVAR_30021_1 [Eumeta japonica]|uniref:Uncharacterized protein n=1 Tax=Eumeta variegata TaxID=151549 RepID=A0A4C1VTE9_EUMVA|nr:hypothetical protein EVAR_30021_1 [Eumeta japonica]
MALMWEHDRSRVVCYHVGLITGHSGQKNEPYDAAAPPAQPSFHNDKRTLRNRLKGIRYALYAIEIASLGPLPQAVRTGPSSFAQGCCHRCDKKVEN